MVAAGGSVEGTSYCKGTSIQDVRVDHRGRDIAMPEELLDGSDVVARFEQVGREAVAERVTRSGFRDASRDHRKPESALQDGFVEMMAAKLTACAIAILASCRKEPLPYPLVGRVRILPGEGFGELDVCSARREVRVVERSDAPQVVAKGFAKELRENGDSISVGFASPHDDVASAEVDVLDAKACAFHQTKTGTVEQACHELRDAAHGCEHAAHFLASEHDWEAMRTTRSNEILDPRNAKPEHVAIEKHEGAQRLMVGRRGDALRNEMVEKRTNVRRAELARMAAGREAWGMHDGSVARATSCVLEPSGDRRVVGSALSAGRSPPAGRARRAALTCATLL